jgi:hypothetical protein
MHRDRPANILLMTLLFIFPLQVVIELPVSSGMRGTIEAAGIAFHVCPQINIDERQRYSFLQVVKVFVSKRK